MPPRPRVGPTDDWHQIELLARAPGQRTYELTRPVVLFGLSPAERAAATGAAVRRGATASLSAGSGGHLTRAGDVRHASPCQG